MSVSENASRSYRRWSRCGVRRRQRGLTAPLQARRRGVGKIHPWHERRQIKLDVPAIVCCRRRRCRSSPGSAWRMYSTGLQPTSAAPSSTRRVNAPYIRAGRKEHLSTEETSLCAQMCARLLEPLIRHQGMRSCDRRDHERGKDAPWTCLRATPRSPLPRRTSRQTAVSGKSGDQTATNVLLPLPCSPMTTVSPKRACRASLSVWNSCHEPGATRGSKGVMDTWSDLFAELQRVVADLALHTLGAVCDGEEDARWRRLALEAHRRALLTISDCNWLPRFRGLELNSPQK